MYAERPCRVPGAVVWTSVWPDAGTDVWLDAGADMRTDPPPGDGAARVLPDGCMDLLWHEDRLLIAGPDTRAYAVEGAPGARWAGVRFCPGTAPALLGVPAHELRDRRVGLADLWPAARTRRLTALVNAAADPARGLEGAALSLAAAAGPPDPLLRRLVTDLDAGRPVGAAADALGVGARRLHRRALTAFGYGPKTLARVLRLQRALRLARGGVPFAQTAALAGFADQAHLARDVKALAGLPLRELLPRR